MTELKSSLPLMEQYYTVQGEGFHSGRPAYFIRLAGCDVGCVWCDVKDSWDKTRFPQVETTGIVEQAIKSGTTFAVITGGEPCMYDLESLVLGLKEAGLDVALETSGAYPISGEFDWICVSPKKFKLPTRENLEKADELKVIVYNNDDLVWCETIRKETSKNCKLYLQPEWERREKVLPLIVDYVKQNHPWNISLQSHKFINIP